MKTAKKPDLSAHGPYATREDRATARELRMTVRRLRFERWQDDQPAKSSPFLPQLN